jgi:roadblock/LC7 domain-containing protein
MVEFNDIGKLMHLPLENIEPEEMFSAPEFLVNAAAEAVVKAEGRNWLPLIVKETEEYHYQVVSNSLVYAVAQKAQLERVWCIVIDPKPEHIEQVKMLTGESKPKVNLNTASRETIKSALEYLLQEPNSSLKESDLLKATSKISEANRENWSNFNEITKLKCGITGKKLDALKQVFFLAPPPKQEIPPLPVTISMKKASREEIFERLNYLSTYKIKGFDSVDINKASDLLFTTSKTRWKSLNPIANLNCGMDKGKITTLKTLFTL